MPSDDELFRAQAASFDQAAEVYERARPSYPDEVVDWLLEPAPASVLDLGAGTGKFTRLIADRVESLIAVDPSERMLQQLSAHVPSADIRVGAAERIPADDASVDAVFAAQAWHWVDEERAVPEVRRVLKPGGYLGLVWNVRDERVPWVAALTEVMHGSRAEEWASDPTPPGEAERFEVEWSVPFDRPSLLELVASRSYFLTASAQEQARVVTGVEDLLDTHPDLAGRTDWLMPYRTLAFRCRFDG
jgi:SAM-dependent methyltransferase